MTIFEWLVSHIPPIAYLPLGIIVPLSIFGVVVHCAKQVALQIEKADLPIARLKRRWRQRHERVISFEFLRGTGVNAIALGFFVYDCIVALVGGVALGLLALAWGVVAVAFTGLVVVGIVAGIIYIFGKPIENNSFGKSKEVAKVEDKAISPPPRLPSEVEKIAPIKIADRWEVHPVAARDSNNLYVDFLFYSMDTSFSWVYKRDDRLIKDQTEYSLADLALLVKSSLAETVDVAGTKINLSKATDLIVMGTASFEGGAEKEGERALIRATNVARELVKSAAFSGGIHTLNLGQHKRRTDQATGQRPVLIVVVLSKANGVHLGQALADAMKRKKELPHPEDYREFQLAQFR